MPNFRIKFFLAIFSVIALTSLFNSSLVFAGCRGPFRLGAPLCESCSRGTEAYNCSVNGNFVRESARCIGNDPFGSCNIAGWSCDTGAEARAICGGNQPPCVSGYCSGGTDPAGCQNGSQIDCSLRNNLDAFGGTSFEAQCLDNQTGGCSWDRIPNESVGRCSGFSCNPGTKCSGLGQSTCNSGCSWVDTTNQCKSGSSCALPAGASCGQQVCRNSCDSEITDACSDISCNPTCTLDLVPNTVSIPQGSNASFTASITGQNQGFVTQVNFVSSNTSVASVSPTSKTLPPPFSTTASSLSIGTSTITADGLMGGAGVKCTDSSSLTVTPPNPWWQAINSDVGTNGNINSAIPSTCSLPSCNPKAVLDGTGGYPGIVMYGGANFDFSALSTSQGRDNVSSRGWLANSSFLGDQYKYDYFESIIPATVTVNEIATPSVNGGDFNSGGTQSRGYVWYRKQGDLTINGNVNLTGSRKVILLVKNGNLNITGRINIQGRGEGFFMAVVGKDIIIDPSVSHPNNPAIEGIYLADSEIKTGASSNKLYARGSFVAYDGISLERDLGNQNLTTPAEIFEYAPELFVTYPRELTRKRIKWREVAP